MRPMATRLLGRILRGASAPERTAFAARILPALERAVPRTPGGAAFVRSSCADESWASRYLAGRAIGRMVPDFIPADEAWARLLDLSGDKVTPVREAVPFGLAEVVRRAPKVEADLERLVADSAAPSSARKAALRSLVLLAVDPETAEFADRLLAVAARAGGSMAAGVGPVIIGRGISARDPRRAAEILDRWSASDDAVLQNQASLARRRVASVGQNRDRCG